MNNQDYNSLERSVLNWKKEKADFDFRRNKVFGINPPVYLWIFAILFVYVYFIKDAEFSKGDKSNSKPKACNYILYEKPDNKSTVILKDISNIEVKILNETKFYYQVQLIKDGSSHIGYINKGKVSK